MADAPGPRKTRIMGKPSAPEGRAGRRAQRGETGTWPESHRRLDAILFHPPTFPVRPSLRTGMSSRQGRKPENDPIRMLLALITARTLATGALAQEKRKLVYHVSEIAGGGPDEQLPDFTPRDEGGVVRIAPMQSEGCHYIQS